MKAESTIKQEIRKLRAIIDRDGISRRDCDMAYGAEHALRWVLIHKHDAGFVPHNFFEPNGKDNLMNTTSTITTKGIEPCGK